MWYDLALKPGAGVMTEEPKSFTVKDRRHFTPDGRTRESDEPEAPKPEASEPPKAPEMVVPGAGSADVSGEAAGPVDFARFLLSLGAQAGMLLAGPVEGLGPAEALEEARSVIGVLEMLRDKTEGRRTPREEEVLDGLLYELRMAYVARAREGGA